MKQSFTTLDKTMRRDRQVIYSFTALGAKQNEQSITRIFQRAGRGKLGNQSASFRSELIPAPFNVLRHLNISIFNTFNMKKQRKTRVKAPTISCLPASD